MRSLTFFYKERVIFFSNLCQDIIFQWFFHNAASSFKRLFEKRWAIPEKAVTTSTWVVRRHVCYFTYRKCNFCTYLVFESLCFVFVLQLLYMVKEFKNKPWSGDITEWIKRINFLFKKLYIFQRNAKLSPYKIYWNTLDLYHLRINEYLRVCFRNFRSFKLKISDF